MNKSMSSRVKKLEKQSRGRVLTVNFVNGRFASLPLEDAVEALRSGDAWRASDVMPPEVERNLKSSMADEIERELDALQAEAKAAEARRG